MSLPHTILKLEAIGPPYRNTPANVKLIKPLDPNKCDVCIMDGYIHTHVTITREQVQQLVNALRKEYELK